MTTVAPEQAAPQDTIAAEADPTPPGATADSRQPLLRRPLTSYYLLLGSTALLVVLGLVMVLSASSVRSYDTHGSSFAIFSRQLMWVGVGLPALLVARRLPVAAYRLLGYPLLVGTFVLLLLVLVPGLGVRVDGAQRWLGLGPLQLQPSELAKLALALWGADLLVRKQRLLVEWRHLLVPLVPVTCLLSGLIMLQPDLGTTIAVLLVATGLLWVVGAPVRLFGGLGALAVTGVTVLAIVEPYRRARLTAFLDPFADPQNTGFQAVQGLYAVSSGGWFGLGLGASREKWSGLLPNAHTDFVFAIIGEELGLIGTLAVILLFAVLAYAGVRIARRTADPFARLVAGSVTFWIIGQAILNMMTVLKLAPITGIPLPLISFGGTALVMTMFAIGMLASFALLEPGAAEAFASRRRVLASLRGWRRASEPPPAGGGSRRVWPRPATRARRS